MYFIIQACDRIWQAHHITLMCKITGRDWFHNKDLQRLLSSIQLLAVVKAATKNDTDERKIMQLIEKLPDLS